MDKKFNFKKLTNKHLKNVSAKTAGIIGLLALADVLVFLFPSYLKNVISQEIIALNLGVKTEHLTQATAIYGYISVAIYFFGSILGDKFSVKWLTIIGLSVFGFTGFWYGSLGVTGRGGLNWDPILNNGAGGVVLNEIGLEIRVIQLYIIYSIWAFAKVIFWAPLWKLLSQQGKVEENGLLNGLEGSFNGLIGTILVAFAYVVFMILGPVFINAQNQSTWAFAIMCFIFATLVFVAVVLLILYVKEDPNHHDDAKSFNLQNLKRVVKNYKIWLVSLVVMGVYMFQQGLSVLVPYLQFSLGMLGVVVFIGGLLRTYVFRFFFSTPAGKFADKTGKYIKFLIIGICIASLLVLIAILLPGFTPGWLIHEAPSWYRWTTSIVVYILFLTLGAICWMLVTNRWATIFEIGTSRQDYASAIGLVSVIAFTPDAWFNQLQTELIRKYKVPDSEIIGGYNNQIAYQILLTTIIIVGIIGAIAGLVLMYINKKEQKKRNEVQNNLLNNK